MRLLRRTRERRCRSSLRRGGQVIRVIRLAAISSASILCVRGALGAHVRVEAGSGSRARATLAALSSDSFFSVSNWLVELLRDAIEPIELIQPVRLVGRERDLALRN